VFSQVHRVVERLGGGVGITPRQQQGVNMYIGIGTIVLILAIVIVVMLMRGRRV
jgi:hypothetical protein